MTLLFFKKLPGLAIQDWLESNGFGDLALYLPNPNQPQIGFLILFIPQDYRTSRHKLTQEIAKGLTTEMLQYDTPCIIGISQPHHHLKDLNTAFNETSVALNQRKLGDNISACYYFDGEYEPKMLNWELQDEFLFRIEAGMTSEIRILIEKLFTTYQSTSDYTLADVKYHCYHLSGQCRLILDNYLNHGDFKSVSNSMQNIVSHIFQLNELKSYYLQFFLNIAEMLKSQSVYAGDDVVEKIQIYMQRNYQKDLTQEFIASLFYLNRSYLSTLFKAKTGQKFIDYLNDIRIEKSKEILAGSDRKMYQIAKFVGYDNVKYFFRIFKKKVGITPEQYRLVNKH